MYRCRFGGNIIDSAGYDAQCAILEVRFSSDGVVCRYLDVPEDTWYCFKEECKPDDFFQRFIKGKFYEICLN